MDHYLKLHAFIKIMRAKDLLQTWVKFRKRFFAIMVNFIVTRVKLFVKHFNIYIV